MNIIFKNKIIKHFIILVISFICICHFVIVNIYGYNSLENNDGSAFITKSEFDTMQAKFQDELNKYDTNIDRKIDDAIAGYLKGIVINNESDESLIYSDWGKVTSMNYIPTNNWQLMDLDLTYTYMQFSHLTTGGLWTQNSWAYANIQYNRPDTTYQQRLLCDAGVEQETEPTSVIWGGVALDYRDKLTRSKIIYGTATHVDDNTSKKKGRVWFNAYGSCNLNLCNIVKIRPGYYSNLEEKYNFTDEDIEPDQDMWTVRIYNYNTSSTYYTYYLRQSETFAVSCGTTVSLNEVADKTKEYEHIITWKQPSGESYRLSDPDWNHHLTDNPGTNQKRSDYSSVLTKTGQWSGTEGATTSSSSTNKIITNFTNYYIGDYQSNVDNNPSVSVGLLSNAYDMEHINQTDKIKEVKVGDTQYTTEVLNLLNGFVCFAANAGDVITWVPKFANTTKNGTSSTYELNVELATAKFGNENSVPTANIIKCEGQTNDYLTTESQTCEFTFTMPSNGLVYCKWWPADSSGISSTDEWTADLDIEASSTYHRVYH